jgi:hypothetical protein
VAEEERRRWIAFEERIDYVAASAFGFVAQDLTKAEARYIYAQLLAGQTIHLDAFRRQPKLLDLATGNLNEPASSEIL